MSSSKEIELVLQAKLEASQAVSQAEQMGRAIVTQIESAIDNSQIGEKLMNKVLAVFRSNFSQYLNQDMPGGTFPGATPTGNRPGGARGLVDQYGFPINPGIDAGQAGAPSPASTNAPQNRPTQQAPSNDPMSVAARAGYGGYVGSTFRASHRGTFSSIASSLGGRFEDLFGEEASIRAASTDNFINKVKAGQLMKKIDPNFNTENLYSESQLKEKREEVKGIAAAGAKEVSRLSDVMERLIKSVDKNSERKAELEGKKDLTKSEQQEYQQILSKEQQMARVAEMQDRAQADLKRASIDVAELDKAMGPAKETSLFKNPKFWGMMGAAGTVAGAVGALPGQIRQFNADAANIGNFTTRSLAEGNLDKVLATGALGGQDSLRNEGMFETGMGIVGKTLSGAAMGAVGGSFIPGLGTIAGAAVGAGVGLYHGITGASSNVRGSMEDQVQKHMAENEELYGMTRAGRNAAIGAYRTAQSMGAPEMSYFLSGGESLANVAGAGISARERAGEIQSQYDELLKNPNLTPAARDRIKASGARKVAAANAQADAFGSRESNAAAMSTYDQFSGGVVNFREYAARRGLSNGQFEGMLGTLGATMGGAFGDSSTPAIMSGNKQGIRDLINAQAAGFGGAAQVAGGLFQGGMDRNESMRQSAKMFEEAVAGGFDKATAGKAMVQMAAQASSSLGGAYGASSSMSRAMAAAQNMFGGDGRVEGRELDYVNKVQNFNQNFAKAGGGPGMIMGMMGVMGTMGDLKSDLGLKGNLSIDKMEMIRQLADRGGSDADIRKFLEGSGMKGITDENQAEVAKRLRNTANRGMKEFGRFGEGASNLMKLQGGLFGDLKEANDESAIQAALQADPTLNRVNGFTNKGAAESQDALGKKESTVSELADADKIIKGLSTLDMTFGLLNDSLKNLINRANEVLKQAPSTFSNLPTAPIGNGRTAKPNN